MTSVNTSFYSIMYALKYYICLLSILLQGYGFSVMDVILICLLFIVVPHKMPSFSVSLTTSRELGTIQAVFQATYDFYARYVSVLIFLINNELAYSCIFVFASE